MDLQLVVNPTATMETENKERDEVTSTTKMMITREERTGDNHNHHCPTTLTTTATAAGPTKDPCRIDYIVDSSFLATHFISM